jgi:hypothetical protein
MNFGENDNHNLGYDACDKICAEIKIGKFLEGQRKVTNSLCMMLELIGDLKLIFGLNLSIGNIVLVGEACFD